MDRAKQAVNDFIGKSGHHTTVDESVSPAVTSEHVKPHHHENVQTAIQREVHQDHHHTTVQPVTHKEVLPEEHSHNIVPVEHKSFEHGNEHDVRQKLEMEAARFKNTSTTHAPTTSTATAPTVEGERVHHHVHEHVQPIVHKETVQPKVVHTTVPVHETHHAAAEHHGLSTLPAKSITEFTGAGGILDGKGTTHHGEYDGCPRPYNKSLQEEQLESDRNMHHHTHGAGHNHNDTGLTGNSTGTTGSTGLGGNNTGYNGTDSGYNNTSGTTGTGRGLDTTRSDASATGHKKPSLMDRLNPKKDTDGDGKAGIMD